MNAPAKSLRAAQMKMAKLAKQHDEAVLARNAAEHAMAREGCTNVLLETHVRQDALVATLRADMKAFQGDCGKVGWFVDCETLRYLRRGGLEG